MRVRMHRALGLRRGSVSLLPSACQLSEISVGCARVGHAKGQGPPQNGTSGPGFGAARGLKLASRKNRPLEMRLLTRLSWVAMALAALHGGVGVGLSFYGTEGWFGGIVYALLYALPLLLIALALRSSRSWLHIAAGWAALVLAVYCSFIVVASWSGFSRDDVFMVCTTAPTVALDLVIFWATVLRRSRRSATSVVPA